MKFYLLSSMGPGVYAARDGVLHLQLFCVPLVFELTFYWALPPQGQVHRTRSKFWKFYLIKTGFTLSEPVSCVTVFRLFRLERSFWVFRVWTQQLDVQHLIYWQGQRVCDALFTRVFWGISPNRRTLGVVCWGSSPIFYVPTFPWKYFFSTKWERSEEIKRELFT